MKHIITTILLFLITATTYSQENVYPAPAQQGNIALTHATIHVGNGTVLEDAMIVFRDGKIMSVGPAEPIKDNAKVIDCSGKHI